MYNYIEIQGADDMNKILSFVTIPTILMTTGCGNQVKFDNMAWKDEEFFQIAHAMGSTEDGLVYTNSLEAFEKSWSDGFRYFEMDIKNIGGKFVLDHRCEGMPVNCYEMEFDDFMEYKRYGKLTNLSLDDVFELMNKYKNMNLAVLWLKPRILFQKILKIELSHKHRIITII